jgi:hypothetical protein
MPGRLRGLAREVRGRLRDQQEIRAGGEPSYTTYPEVNALCLRLSREIGARPDYLWGSLHAAHLAKALGIEEVSLIEFGVAGGNSLIALERIGQAVEKHLGLKAAVWGFDTGHGLPAPTDLRDCPNLFAEGDYPMDAETLRSRLRQAELILGDVAETLGSFLDRRPPPVGFVSFDLDLYSSTVKALRVFEADVDILLPRVHCHFDDITGFTYAEFNGARLAIREFNDRGESRKLSPLYAAGHYVPGRFANAIWVKKIYLCHILDHPLYGSPDGLNRVARRDLSSSPNGPS